MEKKKKTRMENLRNWLSLLFRSVKLIKSRKDLAFRLNVTVGYKPANVDRVLRFVLNL